MKRFKLFFMLFMAMTAITSWAEGIPSVNVKGSVKIGTQTIDISPGNNGGFKAKDASYFDLYEFVPMEDFTIKFWVNQRYINTAVFSEDGTVLVSSYYNDKVLPEKCDLEQGKKYYLGVRSIYSDALPALGIELVIEEHYHDIPHINSESSDILTYCTGCSVTAQTYELNGDITTTYVENYENASYYLYNAPANGTLQIELYDGYYGMGKLDYNLKSFDNNTDFKTHNKWKLLSEVNGKEEQQVEVRVVKGWNILRFGLSKPPVFTHTYNTRSAFVCDEHSIEHVNAVEPSCTQSGNVEYWHCVNCGICWRDEACNNVISEREIIIPTVNHETNAEGVCDICHNKVALIYGENSINLQAGDNVNVYTFTATESGNIDISVIADASVISVNVMTQEEWDIMQGNSEGRLAPRKERGRDPEGTYTTTASVEEGKTYVVVIQTSAEDAETARVIVTNSTPRIANTLQLATFDREGNVTEKPLYEGLSAILGEDYLETFIAEYGVEYKRNATTSRWGTIVLPFKLKSNRMVTYYELSETGDADSEGNAIMTFTPVESVPANTPTVYRFNTEAEKYQYDASVYEPTLIEYPSNSIVETYLTGWVMKGFYEEQKIEDEYWLQSIRYISKDKFTTASKSLIIKPYRAIFEEYMDPTGGMDPTGRHAKTFTIVIANDSEATSIKAMMTENGIEEIEAIYDINGRRQNSLTHGVNIIRTANGKTHKIIKK